jgi:hypothetical protein
MRISTASRNTGPWLAAATESVHLRARLATGLTSKIAGCVPFAIYGFAMPAVAGWTVINEISADLSMRWPRLAL